MEKKLTLGGKFGKYSGRELEEIISETEIEKRVSELAKEISDDYKDKVPILIGVLNGSFIFFSDLFRKMDIDGEVDFIKISSYANETSTSGTVRLLKDISCDITKRDIIIVEDIVDSGLTIKFLKNRLEEGSPNSVKFVSLLMKKSADVDFPIDYIGFKIPNKYVVGYGLDLAQKLRNLRSIYAFK